jgi:hypothetical protein
MGGCAGNLHIEAVTSGQAPQGFVATVFVNGGLVSTSGCMTSGSFDVGIPSGANDVRVIISTGCGGGGDPTSWSISGLG